MSRPQLENTTILVGIIVFTFLKILNKLANALSTSIRLFEEKICMKRKKYEKSSDLLSIFTDSD